MSTLTPTTAGTRIAIRPAMTFNHSETLLAARTRTAAKEAARETRHGIKLSNHNETLLAARTRVTGTDVSPGTRNGRYLNHNETLLAAARP